MNKDLIQKIRDKRKFIEECKEKIISIQTQLEIANNDLDELEGDYTGFKRDDVVENIYGDCFILEYFKDKEWYGWEAKWNDEKYLPVEIGDIKKVGLIINGDEK